MTERPVDAAAGNQAADRPEQGVETTGRRRPTEVFGEVLPEATRDDTEADGDVEERNRADERWYTDNRPPHHDRGTV